MQHFRDAQDNVFGFESASEAPAGLVPITYAEAVALGAAAAPPIPRRVEILARLGVLDAESVRALRAVSIARSAAAPVPAFDRDKLAALEVEAAALRAELAALGA